MSEIAKCPVCGEKPTILNYYGDDYEKSYACCDVEIHGIALWNQYAAAMKAEARLNALKAAVKKEHAAFDALNRANFKLDPLDRPIWTEHGDARAEVERLIVNEGADNCQGEG